MYDVRPYCVFSVLGTFAERALFESDPVRDSYNVDEHRTCELVTSDITLNVSFSHILVTFINNVLPFRFFGPSFSTPAIWSAIFRSCIFQSARPKAKGGIIVNRPLPGGLLRTPLNSLDFTSVF